METWVGWGGERAARDMAKSSRAQGDSGGDSGGDQRDLEGRPSLALSSVLRSDGVPITPPLSSATAAVAAAKARSYRTATTTGGLSEPLLLLSNKSVCEPLTEPDLGWGERLSSSSNALFELDADAAADLADDEEEEEERVVE